jgi:hypothetical protein
MESQQPHGPLLLSDYLDASNRLTVVPVQTSGITFGAGKSTKVKDR